MRATALFQFWPILLNPSPDTTRIDLQTSLHHHFRHVEVGDRIAQIPADAMQNHLAGIVAPFEWLRRGDGHRSRVLNRHPAVFATEPSNLSQTIAFALLL